MTYVHVLSDYSSIQMSSYIILKLLVHPQRKQIFSMMFTVLEILYSWSLDCPPNFMLLEPGPKQFFFFKRKNLTILT